MKEHTLKLGTKLLKSLANEKRMEIVNALADKELSVTELLKVINLSQSSISQHLSILRIAKIVKTRRAAQTIYYSIQNPNALKILSLLEKIYDKPYQ